MERSAFRLPVVAHVVDGDEGHRAGLVQPLRVFLGAHAELPANLLLRGAPAEALLEGVDRLLMLAGAGADPPRAPVHAAQLVEYRPADSRGRVSGEGVAL